MSARPRSPAVVRRAEIARVLASAEHPPPARSSYKRRLDALEREYEQEIDVLGRLHWPVVDDQPFGVAGFRRVRMPRSAR